MKVSHHARNLIEAIGNEADKEPDAYKHDVVELLNKNDTPQALINIIALILNFQRESEVMK